MTKYTNINILDDTRRFKYIIEYQDNIEFEDSSLVSYHETDRLRVDFFNDNYARYIRKDNYWLIDNEDTIREYIPDNINMSSVNVYFPTNSVESYINNNLYMLTVNTWIHGHIVYLGTYLIDRRDAIACKQETKFLNTRYYEYINIKFIDPWYLTYSDDWKDFRQNVCGETELDGMEQNNTGSVLNFTLYPVVWGENKYIKLDPYIGGQNAINLSDEVSDYISCNLTLKQSNSTLEEVARCELNFNRAYCVDGVAQTINDLRQYIKETYCVDSSDMLIRYEIVVLDKDDIYKIIIKDDKPTNESLSCEFTRDELKFDNWKGFKEGLKFVATAYLYLPSDDSSDDTDDFEDSVMMRIQSNYISITQDVMKYFIGDNPVNYVSLTLVDMKNYTINAVNKIEKKIIQIDKPNDTKANLIKPVYFRVFPLSNVLLHPAVTEHICINLDAYKSQVTTFFIQIEGVVFVETARTNAGVIFKISGANLPNEESEGTYYILNQDKELITTGKYKYEG